MQKKNIFLYNIYYFVIFSYLIIDWHDFNINWFSYIFYMDFLWTHRSAVLWHILLYIVWPMSLNVENTLFYLIKIEKCILYLFSLIVYCLALVLALGLRATIFFCIKNNVKSLPQSLDLSMEFSIGIYIVILLVINLPTKSPTKILHQWIFHQ